MTPTTTAKTKKTTTTAKKRPPRQAQRRACHPSVEGNNNKLQQTWIPAFTGMTALECGILTLKVKPLLLLSFLRKQESIFSLIRRSTSYCFAFNSNSQKCETTNYS
jgi:hypothetical protein